MITIKSQNKFYFSIILLLILLQKYAEILCKNNALHKNSSFSLGLPIIICPMFQPIRIGAVNYFMEHGCQPLTDNQSPFIQAVSISIYFVRRALISPQRYEINLSRHFLISHLLFYRYHEERGGISSQKS